MVVAVGALRAEVVAVEAEVVEELAVEVVEELAVEVVAAEETVGQQLALRQEAAARLFPPPEGAAAPL